MCRPGAAALPAQLPLRRLHLLLALEKRHLAAEHDSGHAAGCLRHRGDCLPELLRDPRVAPPDDPYVARVVADDGLGGAGCARRARGAPRTPPRGRPRRSGSSPTRSPATVLRSLAGRRGAGGRGRGGRRRWAPPVCVSIRRLTSILRMASACVRLQARSALRGTPSGSRPRRGGGRLRRRRGTPGGTGGGACAAEEAARLIRPALALRCVELGIGDGEEAALVQRSERRVARSPVPAAFRGSGRARRRRPCPQSRWPPPCGGCCAGPAPAGPLPVRCVSSSRVPSPQPSPLAGRGGQTCCTRPVSDARRTASMRRWCATASAKSGWNSRSLRMASA